MPTDLLLTIALLCTLLAAAWRASHLATSIHALPLLVLAGLSQLPMLLGGPYREPLVGIAFVGLWCACNWHLSGAGWLLLGLVGNGLAMLSHGGAMPLDPGIARQLGLDASALLVGSKDVIGDGTLWVYLGDWLPLRTPWSTVVFSPGDLCIFVALLQWSLSARRQADRAMIEARPGTAASSALWS